VPLQIQKGVAMRFSTFEGQRPPLFRRGPAKFEGGRIVLDARRAETYDPTRVGAEIDGLLFDLAAVESDEDAVQFVGKYGRLRSDRDPWALWEQTVLSLRSCLELYDDFRLASLGRARAVADLRSRGFDHRGPTARDIKTSVALALELLVNEGLRGTEERVRMTLEDSSRRGVPPFESTSQPRDPIGLAFAQLKALIVPSVPVKKCAECKRYFPVDDARRRFHSTECQARARWRKWSKAHPNRRRVK
jgi:hypothetical protein